MIQIFYSSVSGNIKIKTEQRRIESVLQSLNIEYQLVDVAADLHAKDLMFRMTKSKLVPQIFVDGQFRGFYEDFANSVESEKLEQFLGK